MKQFVLASGIVLLTAGVYVWGSKPAGHLAMSGQNLYKASVSDTVPKKNVTL